MSEYLLKEISAVEGDDLPWLVFKLQNLTYTINSRIVTSILQLSENITPVASAPDTYRGVYNFRGNALPLLDLRKVFGMKSSMEECDAFAENMNGRKQDHINYVNELENFVNTKKPFSLTLDPHSCKLGRWLDNLSSMKDNSSVAIRKHLSMSDLLKFHSNIHILARDIIEYKSNGNDSSQTDRFIIERLDEIKKNRDKVISLLDDVIRAFMESYREMVVVISNENVSLGLIVDEVVAVDKLDILSDADRFPNFQKTKFFTGIAENPKIEGEILLVNEQYLLGMFEEYSKLTS